MPAKQTTVEFVEDGYRAKQSNISSRMQLLPAFYEPLKALYILAYGDQILEYSVGKAQDDFR